MGVSLRHLAKLSGQAPLIETRFVALARAFLACQQSWCLTLLGHHGVRKIFAGKWLVMQAFAADERSLKLITPGDLRDQSRVPEHRQALLSMTSAPKPCAAWRSSGPNFLRSSTSDGTPLKRLRSEVIYRWRHSSVDTLAG